MLIDWWMPCQDRTGKQKFGKEQEQAKTYKHVINVYKEDMIKNADSIQNVRLISTMKMFAEEIMYLDNYVQISSLTESIISSIALKIRCICYEQKYFTQKEFSPLL